MSQNSKIEWCHHTFNPWWGCAKVSAGCQNCYAESFARRFGVGWGVKGKRRPASAEVWEQPRRWNAAAAKKGKRARVFCSSMADVFEDRPELVPWRKTLWYIIKATPYLDWLLLTKRPENIRKMLPEKWGNGWANVWLGTSAEDQKTLEERMPPLLKVPAVVHFLSAEPLLGPLDITSIPFTVSGYLEPPHHDVLDWVIVGGESGHGARPMHPKWATSLRDQSEALGIAFFFKQWGEWHPVVFDPGDDEIGITPAGQTDPETKPRATFDFVDGESMERLGKRVAGRMLDGVEWNEFPQTPMNTGSGKHLEKLAPV
jgi:protein gp37